MTYFVAVDCQWSVWNTSAKDACKECRKATFDRPYIIRNRTIHTNATFGGKCDEENGNEEEFSCTIDNLEKEGCKMSNIII